jgi:hypothetical protein
MSPSRSCAWAAVAVIPGFAGRARSAKRRDLLSELDLEVRVTPPVYMDAWGVGVLDELTGVGR